jgi:hypothetical protein
MTMKEVESRARYGCVAERNKLRCITLWLIIAAPLRTTTSFPSKIYKGLEDIVRDFLQHNVGGK